MKTLNFSEIIAASDLKVDRCRQLIELIKVRIEGHGHFFTLAQGNLHMQIKTRFSQIPLGYFEPNFVCNLSGTRRHDAGHMTKVAAMSVHGKTQKASYLVPVV